MVCMSRISGKYRAALLGIGAIGACIVAVNIGAQGSFSLDYFPAYFYFWTSIRGLVAVVLLSWISSKDSSTTTRVWWAPALALLVGSAGAVAASERVHSPGFSLVGRVFWLSLLGVVLTSVLIVRVRPQLFLAAGHLFVLQNAPSIVLGNLNASEWTIQTLVPFAVGSVALAWAITGTRSALRT
jgi:hypothetical protein